MSKDGYGSVKDYDDDGEMTSEGINPNSQSYSEMMAEDKRKQKREAKELEYYRKLGIIYPSRWD
jgi:hypothetical protein